MTLGSGKRCFSRVIVFFVLLFEIIPISVSLEARLSLKVDMDGGFHRTLKYRVEFDEPMKDCHTAIYLELPSALYVNVDELAELRRLGVVTACSVGETDVELFMEKAMPQNVCASSPITDSEATVKLPIHQRYQYAKDRGGYVTVTLPKPKLLLGCKERIREYRVSKIDLCSSCAKLVPKWREIPYIMNQEDTVWLVPVGDSSLSTIIIFVTLFTTILGAMFVARTILTSASKERPKRD